MIGLLSDNHPTEWDSQTDSPLEELPLWETEEYRLQSQRNKATAEIEEEKAFFYLLKTLWTRIDREDFNFKKSYHIYWIDKKWVQHCCRTQDYRSIKTLVADILWRDGKVSRVSYGPNNIRAQSWGNE